MTVGCWALAHRVGMKHFATDSIWGKTRITADDQTEFLDRHRSLRRGTPSRVCDAPARVGHACTAVGHRRDPPAHWSLYFKGGWGSGTGLLDHQVVLLTRGCTRTSLAVLTMFDGSHQYGKDTLRGIFSRLLRGFPTAKELAWRVSSRGGDPHR